MKRLFIILSAFILSFSFIACGDQQPHDSSVPDTLASESSEPLSPESKPEDSTTSEETTAPATDNHTTDTENRTDETESRTDTVHHDTTAQESVTTTQADRKTTVKKTVRTTTTTKTKRSATTTTTAVSTDDVKISWEVPATNYQSNQYSNYITYRTPLTNSYQKLTKDRKLKVLYLGGSLTNGSGVAEMDTLSWRGLTGAWLNETFPDADITNVNVAIGATGSELGVYRLKENVIEKSPDLLFVEFAVNDYYYSTVNTIKSRSSFETLVREVRQSLPYCDIVVLITTERGCIRLYHGKSVTPHPTAVKHMEIAEAYGLPVVNIADAFVDEVADITGNDQWFNDNSLWYEYITDDVHPGSKGYAMWFKYVKEYLSNSLLHTDYSGCKTTARKVPAVQSANLLDGNRQSYLSKEISKVIVKSDGTLTYVKGETPTSDGYYALQQGGSMTLKFTGTECAIWTMFESNEFKITYTIDGKDTYTMEEKWGDPYYLISNLEPGEHTVEITHCEDSKVKALRLIGFFMRDASKQTTAS